MFKTMKVDTEYSKAQSSYLLDATSPDKLKKREPGMKFGSQKLSVTPDTGIRRKIGFNARGETNQAN